MSDWKNNRPGNWQKLIGIKYGAIPPKDALMFEAGADAMLEALKSSSIQMKNYHPINRTVMETAAFLNQCEDGMLVFIPEESK